MRESYGFAQFHPVVTALYFAVLLCISMLCMHPVLIGILSGASLLYYGCLKGRDGLLLLMKGILPLFLLAVLVNCLFQHTGQTKLFIYPNGKAMTLESLIFGACAGSMLVSVLVWFACLHEVLGSDKIMYLFGKRIPSLALLLSMTLGLIPGMKNQFEQVTEAQAMLGRNAKKGGTLRKVRSAIACFSIVTTWSMENAIDTADSMKARGYGSGERSVYAIYEWSQRDREMLAFVVISALFFLGVGCSGSLSWKFYPVCSGSMGKPLNLCMYLAASVYALMPSLIHRREERSWK